MKNVLILGAGGNIAGKVIDMLSEEKNIRLTLLLRNAGRLKNKRSAENCRIIEADVLNMSSLGAAMVGIDIVYANLAGDLEQMAKNIVKAMDKNGVKRLLFISSIGIYDDPVRPVLIPYRRAADVIEASDTEFTILRPAWFTKTSEVDYEVTRKGEPEKGSVISEKSVATLVATIILSPEMYVRESLGINKPNS